jgi:hypothetical protein
MGGTLIHCPEYPVKPRFFIKIEGMFPVKKES